MDTTKAKEQIRKLLDLAADDAAGQTFEADNAMAFARRLMLKHNIDEAELTKARSAHEQAADEQYADAVAYSAFTRIMPWEGVLSQAIAGLLGTVGVYVGGQAAKRTDGGLIDFDTKGREQQRTAVVFYGPEADVRDARDLFNEWCLVILTMTRARFGQAVRGEGRAYSAGFATALYEKVEWMAKKEKHAAISNRSELITDEFIKGYVEGETGTTLALTQGLALVTAKKQAAEKWLEEEKGVKLHSRAATGPGFKRDAYGEGQADGNKADFSHTKTKRLGS